MQWGCEKRMVLLLLAYKGFEANPRHGGEEENLYSEDIGLYKAPSPYPPPHSTPHSQDI
jgi:hypothetical protein